MLAYFSTERKLYLSYASWDDPRGATITVLIESRLRGSPKRPGVGTSTEYQERTLRLRSAPNDFFAESSLRQFRVEVRVLACSSFCPTNLSQP